MVSVNRVRNFIFFIVLISTPAVSLALCPDVATIEDARQYDARAATVLFFVDTECPIANQYAPKMERIVKAYAEKDVCFVRIYSGDYYDETDLARHAEDYGFTMPALMDKEYALALETGARITPEAVVVDRKGEVRYCGRIDNKYKGFGKYRPEATVEDLTDALDAVLAGREVEVKKAKAIGCFMNVPEEASDGNDDKE